MSDTDTVWDKTWCLMKVEGEWSRKEETIAIYSKKDVFTGLLVWCNHTRKVRPNFKVLSRLFVEYQSLRYKAVPYSTEPCNCINLSHADQCSSFLRYCIVRAPLVIKLRFVASTLSDIGETVLPKWIIMTKAKCIIQCKVQEYSTRVQYRSSV